LALINPLFNLFSNLDSAVSAFSELFSEVPKVNAHTNYFVDGVCLSEIGNLKIRALTMEQPKKKRSNNKNANGKGLDAEAGILATIESVVSGGKL
jgi:hypothetical protein